MLRSFARLSLSIALTAGASGIALGEDSLPPRKSGLWESKVTSEGGDSTVRQCIDEKTDTLAQSGMAGAATCSKKTLTKTSAGYETESDCKIGPISASGKGLISGDFESKIRVETTSVLSGLPSQKEPVTRKMVIETRWVGPCEKGQSPGDIILPGGKIVKMPGGAPTPAK
ncbi:DUF3617 domain-containing protein [Methylobacterium sp. sgz302541]|uniref:DUF3617 domain-containing protein n=1 Tax=unclassified Methylobacterium TaxID=2615210 RepID=UPI003D3476EE